MKKNILTIMVLALCLANLGMSAVLIFTVVPTSKKTDALITQVASVINLELVGYTDMAYKASDLEPYKIDQTLTRNLKQSADGSSHFAAMNSVTLSMNMNCEGYEELKLDLAKRDAKVMDIIGTIISSYPFPEIQEKEEEVKESALKEIRKFYGVADFVVDISFDNLVYN